MNPLKFSIDKVESEAASSLVICSSEPLSLLKIRALTNLKSAAESIYRQEIDYQQRIKGKRAIAADTAFSLFHITQSEVIEILQLLAAAGALFFKGSQLVCDFFSKSELFFTIDNSVNEPFPISAVIKTVSQEFSLANCDFVNFGPPHFYIKGIALRFIGTEISRKELKQAYAAPQEITLQQLQKAFGGGEDAMSPKLHYKEPLAEEIKNAVALASQLEPWPLLLLKDRSGAFADLWMTYDSESLQTAASSDKKTVRVALHDQNPKLGMTSSKRNSLSERQWEQDLLHTDYIKKLVGTTHYYCPVDCVAKSLTFLLEVGWQIEDWQGKPLYHHTGTELEISAQLETILVKGKLQYGEHTVDLKDLVGAFNRRERFVQLGSGAVGLLPTDIETQGFNLLAEEGEVVGGAIGIKRQSLGMLSDLFDSSATMTCDAAILELRQALINFSGIKHTSPGDCFKGVLRPYQQEGVDWLAFLYEHGFHGLLADDMGLGKTVQVLAFISQLTIDSPLLIVVPTSLIFNWKREIEHFLPDMPLYIHHGPKRSSNKDELNKPHIVITSYSTLRLDLNMLKQFMYGAVILDEGQSIKNSETQIAQAVYQLQARFRLSLTGTPLENHLGEMWSHFRFLMPDLLGEKRDFLADAAAGSADFRYFDKLRKKIKPFLLRRKKEEVAKDLPEKIEQVVWVDMAPEQRKVYDDFLAGFRGNLFKKVEVDGVSKHRMEVLEAILRLRQICCHPQLVLAGNEELVSTPSAKLDMLMEDIETAIDEGSKVLVYSQFTSMLKLIAKEVRKRQWNFAYLDGATVEREKEVMRFQEDKGTPLFLISLKAGGVGLNLTAADCVFLYDPWWNEAIESQAINRAHRIGRCGTVVAKRYIVVETIEEKMVKLKAHKSALIDDILGGQLSTSALTMDDLRFLLS